LLQGKSIIVSIVEPVQLVKDSFYNYISMLIYKQDSRVKTLNLDYNHVPFFNALLNDIFDDSTRIGDTPPSTAILVDDGMEYEYAIELALKAFRMLLDIITTYVPDIDFSSDGYGITMCGEYDLFISSTYLDELRDDDEV
jgi:hypothetical protein